MAWLREQIQDHLTVAAICAARNRPRLAKLHQAIAASKRLLLLRAGERL